MGNVVAVGTYDLGYGGYTEHLCVPAEHLEASALRVSSQAPIRAAISRLCPR